LGLPDPDRDAQFYRGVPLRRLVAFFIDAAVILALTLSGMFVAAVIWPASLDLGGNAVLLLILLTGAGYRWTMVQHRSATLGMVATGIELRARTGERLSGAEALIHTVAFSLSLAFLPLAIVGWIRMAADPHRRAIHDLILGTSAINRPV